MADKNNKEDLNNTRNDEMDEMDFEIDDEILDFFRNETNQGVPQGPLDNHPPDESTGGDQREGDSTTERITEDDVSSLMDESIFNREAEEYPPDDFDGEMWNVQDENIDFIKLPFPI